MSDMIERVAKAIARHIHKDADYGLDGDTAFESRRDDFIGIARAAIEAMREPDMAMMMAGYDATRQENGAPQFAETGFCVGHAGRIFFAMIDAALSQNTLHSISPDPQLSVGSDGSPSTLSSEAGGAKMARASNASPDRAAQAGISNANSEQAVTHSSSSAEPPRVADAQAGEDNCPPPQGSSPAAPILR